MLARDIKFRENISGMSEEEQEHFFQGLSAKHRAKFLEAAAHLKFLNAEQGDELVASAPAAAAAAAAAVKKDARQSLAAAHAEAGVALEIAELSDISLLYPDSSTVKLVDYSDSSTAKAVGSRAPAGAVASGAVASRAVASGAVASGARNYASQEGAKSKQHEMGEGGGRVGDRERGKEDARDRDPIAHLSQLQIAERAMLGLSERERALKDKTEREKRERAKWKALEESRERQRLEEAMRQRNREMLPNYNLNHDADQQHFRESTGFLTADTPADLAIFRVVCLCLCCVSVSVLVSASCLCLSVSVSVCVCVSVSV
jgi:hypothetical protein